MHTTLEQIQQAREQLLAARKPFDDALAALDRAERHADYLRRIITNICQGLNPEWVNAQALDAWLRAGVFPQPTAWGAGDLRIDGRLTQPHSFLAFLKENMGETPTWEPPE